MHKEIKETLGAFASMGKIAAHYKITPNDYNMGHLNNLVGEIVANRRAGQYNG
jgi:hypothetical protein